MVGETETSWVRGLQALTKVRTKLNGIFEWKPILRVMGSIETLGLKKDGKKILYQTGNLVCSGTSASWVGQGRSSYVELDFSSLRIHSRGWISASGAHRCGLRVYQGWRRYGIRTFEEVSHVSYCNPKSPDFENVLLRLVMRACFISQR